MYEQMMYNIFIIYYIILLAQQSMLLPSHHPAYMNTPPTCM